MTLRLAWFATGRGQMSGKLLAAAREAIEAGRLNAEIAVVFCNRAPGEDANTDAFLEQVRASGIPLVTLSSRDFRKRVGGERRAQKERGPSPLMAQSERPRSHAAPRTACRVRYAATARPGFMPDLLARKRRSAGTS